MLYEKIVALLTENGVAFDILHHEVIRTAVDAERAVPGLVDHLVKTVAFQVKEGAYVLAGVPARARIDYKLLADLLGVNRRLLRSLSPEQVEAELGFEVGGVGPFPVVDKMHIYFDTALADAGLIYCGSGRNTRTVAMQFADLLAVSGGELVAITKE
jgi:Cys-tRNA(Pro)/Cys-tRNA(Cys) deacylase